MDSWDWTNAQLHAQELQENYPLAHCELIEVFEQLVAAAMRYKEITGHYLQVWANSMRAQE